VELGIEIKGLTDAHVMSRVYRALRNHSWLLVFNNVDNALQIRDYLPSLELCVNQRVLLTSCSNWWVRKVPVRGFNEAEALYYLQYRLQCIDESSCKALAEKLSYFPLALSQAAAYITASGCTVSIYLELLSREPFSVRGKSGLEWKYKRTIKCMWAVSKELVKQNPNALRLVYVCAWLAAEGIPIYLLDSLLGDSLAALEAVKVVAAFALVDESNAGYLTMHRLVQLVVGEDRAALIELPTVTTAMYSIYQLHKQTPAGIRRNRDLLPHMIAVLRHGENRMQQQPSYWRRSFLDIISCISDIYDTLGHHAKQVEFLKRTLVLKEQHYGRDHFKVAIALSSLGNAYGKLGQLAEKVEMLERVLPIFELHYGCDHEYVAQTHAGIASAHVQQEMLDRPQRRASCLHGCAMCTIL